MTSNFGLRSRGTRLRRVLGVAAVVSMACALAAGCTSAHESGRKTGSSSNAPLPAPGKAAATSPIAKLTVGFSNEPVTTLDPGDPNGGYSGFTFGNLALESLFQIKPDGTLDPWLATKVTQSSPTEYVYALRQGVKFWDGNELTATDVVYSLLNEATENGLVKLGVGNPLFNSVSKIEARDNYTVVVTLKQPDMAWQYTPALFYSLIYEKKFAEAHRKTFGKPGTLVMGTGPWKVDSFDPTTGASLSANPSYWGGEPPIKQIAVKLYSSDTSLQFAMRSGEVDLAPSVQIPQPFKATSGVEVTTVPSCGTSLIGMPTQTAPFNDIHVRRAVAYAINRKDIMAATGGAAAAPIDTLYAPLILKALASASGIDVDTALKSVPTYAYDVDKAKQELAQSAYPKGFTATLAAPSDQNVLKIDQVIAAQLQKVGITVKLQPITSLAYGQLLTGPEDKRPFTFSSTGACTPDPSWDDSLFLGGNLLDVANYQPADVNKLVADGLKTQDPKQRMQTYIAILKRLAEDVPYVPLYAEAYSYASNKYDWVGFSAFWTSTRWALNLKPR